MPRQQVEPVHSPRTGTKRHVIDRQGGRDHRAVGEELRRCGRAGAEVSLADHREDRGDLGQRSAGDRGEQQDRGVPGHHQDLLPRQGARLSGTAAREGGTPSPAPSERAAPTEPEQLQTTAAPDRKLAVRQAIAAAVTRSKREIPHSYLSTRIDTNRALAWLDAENRERPMAERILPAALLLRATALAVTNSPELNGFWVDDAFQPGEAIHLGVVVFLREGGLVAPAILAADRKSLGELMQALTDLVRRARSSGLRGSERTSATITVTHLGDRGVGKHRQSGREELEIIDHRFPVPPDA
jgi:pyruvate/2-oxoglutarate dehydrogenase complex dihydrolipoamide acyltransferase (E2) component